MKFPTLSFAHLLGIRVQSKTEQPAENEQRMAFKAPEPQSVATQIVKAGRKRRAEIEGEPPIEGPAFEILQAGRRRRGEVDPVMPGGVAGKILAAAGKARGE